MLPPSDYALIFLAKLFTRLLVLRRREELLIERRSRTADVFVSIHRAWKIAIIN